MYRLRIRHRSPANTPSAWLDYEKISGTPYETENIAEAEGEMRFLLNTTPVPLVQIIQIIPTEVTVASTI